MQHIKVVLFNGAPRSGKDTAAHFLCGQFLARKTLNIHPIHRKMAEVLKDGAHALFGLDVPHDHFEYCKDLPLSCFFEKTPREVYISLSENWMKPNFGKNAFGHIYAQRIMREAQEALKGSLQDVMVICSDCGFEDEVRELVKAFGAANIILFRMHRDGCDFTGDSRSLITMNEITTVDIQNENKIKMQMEIFGHLLHWYDYGKPIVRTHA